LVDRTQEFIVFIKRNCGVANMHGYLQGYLNALLMIFCVAIPMFSVAEDLPSGEAVATRAELIKAAAIRAEIAGKLWNDKKPVDLNPNWNAIAASLAVKYDEKKVEEVLTVERRDFYKRIKNWREFARLRSEGLLKNPPQRGEGLGRDSWALNVDAWDVFENCGDKHVLSQALQWIDMAIAVDGSKDEGPNVQLLDTRANVLYRLGRADEAIAMEKAAADRCLESSRKTGHKSQLYDEYMEIISKMKKGEPTWPVRAGS
jgi:hypothetical protein